MSVLLPVGTAEQQLAERYPTPFLTFIYTLKRHASIPPDLFYGYWRDAHCQISARLPGQHSLWIHFLDFERGGLPVLYRQFGDKNGLLKAVVDHGFERYLDTKRRAEPSDNPLEDLRTGWDTHCEFAVAHPAVYRLMFSPSFEHVPHAAGASMRILRDVLQRCAAAGVLAADIDLATQEIMAANIGVALSLVAQPENYRDPTLSRRVRDAIHRDVLTPEGFAQGPRAPSALAPAANLLAAVILEQTTLPLTNPEQALLHQWLRKLTSDSQNATWTPAPSESMKREARPTQEA